MIHCPNHQIYLSPFSPETSKPSFQKCGARFFLWRKCQVHGIGATLATKKPRRIWSRLHPAVRGTKCPLFKRCVTLSFHLSARIHTPRKLCDLEGGVFQVKSSINQVCVMYLWSFLITPSFITSSLITRLLSHFCDDYRLPHTHTRSQ